tara:strand:- start:585 stop:1118 length:534 start_codon:yes stop_codon:yes gene_type:complete
MNINIEKLEKKNICFTGMMGSGKSSIGRQFAKIINFRFLDTDLLIEESVGKKIGEIFKIYGEDYFRKCEKKVVLDVLKLQNVVISLGGGSILDKEIRKVMEKNSFTIYLEVKIDELSKRLEKSKKRPLLENKNIKNKLNNLLKYRKKYYNKADLKISNSINKTNTIKKLKKFFTENE